MKLYSILPVLGLLMLSLSCPKKQSKLQNEVAKSSGNVESQSYNDSLVASILKRNENDKLILDFYAGMYKDDYEQLLVYYFNNRELRDKYRELTCNLEDRNIPHLCSGFQTVSLVVDNKIINITGSLSGFFNNQNQLDSVILFFDFPYAYPDQWLNDDSYNITPIIDIKQSANGLLELYKSKYGPYNSIIKTKGGNPESFLKIYKWRKDDKVILYSDIETPMYDLKDILKKSSDKNFIPEQTGSSKSVSITYTTSNIIKIGNNLNSNKIKQWENKLDSIKQHSKKDI